MNTQPPLLSTSAGDFPLQEYRLRQSGREWSILHTGAMLTHDDETRFLQETANPLPYGVALWPASIALAHEIASRAEEFRGKKVLELGAGTGLPGIVASSVGGHVVQSDRHEVALSVCKRNGERNSITTIEYRLADWANWEDTECYDWIIGSDILYVDTMHEYLRHIFKTNLARGGRVLLTDPFRLISLSLLEAMEKSGWMVSLTKWRVGEDETPRSIGLFELTPS